MARAKKKTVRKGGGKKATHARLDPFARGQVVAHHDLWPCLRYVAGLVECGMGHVACGGALAAWLPGWLPGCLLAAH